MLSPDGGTGTASAGSTASTGTNIPGLTTDQRNAYTAVLSLFQQYGLEGLAPEILNFVQQGYDAATTNFLLQQTDAYKQRFAGNDQRIKNGLAPLSAAEYLSTEASYQAIMRNSGLPRGFYDDRQSFSQFIGSGVSPTELQSRVQLAAQKVLSTDPNTRQALKDFYGVDDTHLTSYFLDPQKGLQILQNQATASDIGAAALDQGLHADRQQAELFAGMGETGQQAQKDYSTIAGILPEEQKIAQRFGQDYSQTDAENEVIGGLASATRKRQQLNQSEQALFSGSGGIGNSFYHPDYALTQEQGGAF